MYKLAPLSAAIVLALAGQAMAADSTSSQTQDGKENIAEVSQTQASFASATQNQTGKGHNHLAVQTESTSDIQQSATGQYNAATPSNCSRTAARSPKPLGAATTMPSPASR